jgi:ribokinase
MSAQPIVVVGSLNMDLVINVERVPAAGETLVGRECGFVPGGKGANQAVACARLGARVAMIGRVGADMFGQRLLQGLAEDGIGIGHVKTDEIAASGVALVMVDDSAQNRIVLVPGANGSMTPAHIEQAAELIDEAALMITQLEVPLCVVESAVQRAARAGVRVILNPAPACELPPSLWPCIDYLIPNETEASALSGIEVSDLDSAARAARAAGELRARGVRHVLITLGSRGVLISDHAGVRHHDALPVRAVDTTAAGDTFIGAFAVALHEGLALDEATRRATAAAAVCVTRAGAQSSIPYRAEVMVR